MGEDLVTNLSMENMYPSTYLSMDSIAMAHEENGCNISRHIITSCAPDINVPLIVELSPPPPNESFVDMLDVGLGHQMNENDTILYMSKTERKCAKRLDSVWGAWFFFSFYFKPVLKEKSKCNIVRDRNGFSGFDKTDLQHDVFLVQHDMENMYMWVFKEWPEHALGIMQLRSYMNGHSRQGERPFPFCAEKGFVRSHRMQRKHYRGLSNPQCVHGIELVPSPNLAGLEEEDQKKWVELTGRDLNFSIPSEARDFVSWRSLPNTEFELQRPIPQVKTGSQLASKKLLNGAGLNLSTQPSNHMNGHVVDMPVHMTSICNKRRKDNSPPENEDDGMPINQDIKVHAIEPQWMNEFSGVMKNVCGPVTAAKTIYEDDEGYLIVITLPFADIERVKVHWWNNLTHGIVKISSVSTACMTFIQRNERTFKLTDPFPEHCPPGEFKREFSLPTRIPDDAKLEAYFDKSGTVLEILVPKHRVGPEEHEVPICLRPPNDFALS